MGDDFHDQGNSEYASTHRKARHGNNEEIEKREAGQAGATNAVLTRAENYNRSMIEASLDPLVTIGYNGVITDVNAATENATGLPREKLIGTIFSEYFTDPVNAKTGYQLVFKEGRVVDYELELKHISGFITPVLYNASIYKDDAGNTIGVIAAARDITALRNAENKLLQLKSYLELLVKQKTSELLIANREIATQNIEKSDRAAELLIANKELAYQNEEKAKRAAELLITNIGLSFQKEEKADRAAELLIANKELAFQNREKEKRAAELLIANNELENLIDNANAAIIVLDPRLRMMRFNHAMEFITGKSEEECSVKNLIRFFPPENQANS